MTEEVTGVLSSTPGTVVAGARGAVVSADETIEPKTLERLARAVHDAYRTHAHDKGGDQREKPAALGWDELDEEYRQANRAHARHFGRYLKEAGLVPVPLSDTRPEVREFPHDVLERLAKAEHQRWLSEKVKAGWTYGRVKDPLAKTHPDIVPWEELSDDLKEIDRVMVRNIFVALRMVGLKAVKAEGD